MSNALCEASDCIGFANTLDGSSCLTQPVECKDGQPVVRSQGSILRRFAIGGFPDPVGGGPVSVPPTLGVTTNSGPRDAAGTDLLTVIINNPFCSTANILINFEFSAILTMANSDQYAVMGEVSLTGTNFVESNTTPFNTVNPFAAGPGGYGSIAAYAQLPVGVADSGELFQYTHAGSFTVMAQLAAGAAATFVGHCRVDAAPRGALRTIDQYNTAVTMLITPSL